MKTGWPSAEGCLEGQAGCNSVGLTRTVKVRKRTREALGARLGEVLARILFFSCLLGLAGNALPAPVDTCTTRRLVLAEGSPSLRQRDSQVADGSSIPRPMPGWRSWRQHVAEDKNEVKRLRQMMAEAEQNVEQLNDRLLDAKQAQVQ